MGGGGRLFQWIRSCELPGESMTRTATKTELSSPIEFTGVDMGRTAVATRAFAPICLSIYLGKS